MSEHIDDRLDRLESLVEQQQDRIEEQDETIERQRERIDELEEESGDDAPSLIDRRTALQTGGLLGLLGLGAGIGSADSQGQVGTPDDPIETIYANEIQSDDFFTFGLGLYNDSLNDLIDISSPPPQFTLKGTIGTNGVRNESGNLSLRAEDGRSVELSSPLDLAGNDVLSSTESTFLNFDIGTYPTSRSLQLGHLGDVFLGDSGTVTLDDSNLDLNGNFVTDFGGPLTLQGASDSGVNINTDGGSRTLDLGIPSSDGSNIAGGNVVAGHPNNAVNNGAVGVTIGGGGNSDSGGENTVGDHYATIAGGRGNEASGKDAAVGGGSDNIATATQATIGGGFDNNADGKTSTIAGGVQHQASGDSSTISGGRNNTASGVASTVGGGRDNIADGNYSFAAGRNASANGNDGAFVWSDGTDTNTSAAAANEVRFQANGGFVVQDTDSVQFSAGLATGSGTAVVLDGSGNLLRDSSSARYKTNIQPLSTDTAGILELEPREFKYEETGADGVGLIAEEVAKSVPEIVVHDDQGRPDAVQYDRLGVYLIREIRRNRDRIEDLQETVDKQSDRIEDLESENERLHEQLEEEHTHAEAADD